ncbi:methyltransferase family protein [Candidatus Margulisiibacteriota bacterium]
MIQQLLVLAVFIVNLGGLWGALLNKKFEAYRSFGFVVFYLLPLLSVFSSQPRFDLDHFWWRIAGVVFILLGLGLAVWTRKSQRMTSGPYKFVRHPLYLSVILIYVGWWWIWSAVYGFYFGLIILALIWLQAYLEEKFILEQEFGDQYREYRRQTGMFWIK